MQYIIQNLSKKNTYYLNKQPYVRFCEAAIDLHNLLLHDKNSIFDIGYVVYNSMKEFYSFISSMMDIFRKAFLLNN